MPELPEVETVRRGLEPALVGRRILRVETRRDDLRFPFPAGFSGLLEGAVVQQVSRRAKYLVLGFDNGLSLLAHLGMTGRFTLVDAGGADNLGAFYFEASADGPHDHVVFHLEHGVRVVYTDPRRFGMMDVVETAQVHHHRLLKNLGVEPLGNAFSADFLVAKFKGKVAPLKAALLDQRIIAGLGNIYVCEALHAAGLSPKRKATTVKPFKIEELVRQIRLVLQEAIIAGGSTLQDFQHANGQRGLFQQRFQVYGREREPCNCGGKIRRIVQSGRSTFYCPSCQK